jgi:Leucine-rich repeat (LRR) protein
MFACLGFTTIEATRAQTLLIEEKEGDRLVFGRYSTQEDVEALKSRPNVFSLDIQEVSINTTPFFTQQNSTIRELYTSNIPYLEQIIPNLSKNAPNLEVLVLAGSGIKGDLLECLLGLTKLKVLDLTNTHLVDKTHIDRLLEELPNLTIYIDSLTDFPTPSIDLNLLVNHCRVVQKRYSISPYPPNSSILFPFKGKTH